MNPFTRFKTFTKNLKWIGPEELDMKSLMGAAVMMALLAGFLIDVTAIVFRGIAYSRLVEWSKNEAVLGLSSTPSLVGLSSSLLTAILLLSMMICLGFEILLGLFFGDRQLQKGVARTYVIVVVFQVPITINNIIQEVSDDLKVWLLDVCAATSVSTNCLSWWQRVTVASVVPGSISLFVHLIAAAFILHFSQFEAKRDAVLPHIHKPLPPQEHKKNPHKSFFSWFHKDPPTPSPTSGKDDSKKKDSKSTVVNIPKSYGGAGGDISSSDTDIGPLTARPRRSRVSSVTGSGAPSGYGQLGGSAPTGFTTPNMDPSMFAAMGGPGGLELGNKKSGSHRRSNSTGKSSSRTKGSSSKRSKEYKSLPKGMGERRGHKRTESSLEQFNEELGESEDEVDRLMSDGGAGSGGRKKDGLVGSGRPGRDSESVQTLFSSEFVSFISNCVTLPEEEMYYYELSPTCHSDLRRTGSFVVKSSSCPVEESCRAHK